MERTKATYYLPVRKIVLTVLFVFIQTLFLIQISYGGMNEEISIDSLAHSLVAPEASEYQWFYNNEVVKGAKEQALVIDKSGYYTVETKEKDGSFSRTDIFVVVQAGAIKRIYLIGDSTVQDYTAGYYPRKGWGQMLPFFFNSSNVTVVNKAVGGTSSKSYYNSFWTPVKNALQPGDFVFIQFGINDRAADTARHTDANSFKAYLTKFVNETKAKGAIPVLVSTLVRNSWNPDGVTVYPAYHDHPVATRELAAAIKVPLIDLDKKSTALLQSVGKAYSTSFLYNNYKAGEYPNYPNGNTDDVHFQEMGAIEMARLVVQGIRELSTDPNVSTLIPSLVATNTVTISTNNTNAGLVTKSNTYPAGVTVTIKTIPNTGFTFSKWTDGSDVTVSTAVKFTTVMSTSAKTYKAVFATPGNTPPTVSLTAPVNNATFTAPATISLSAIASDVNGTVNNVQFFNGTTLLGTDATSPYSFSWTNVVAGTYSITAKATDNNGAVTTSSVITVKVNPLVTSSVTIQAETACEVDGILLESTNGGFNGSGYVNANNVVGSAVNWSFNSPGAQTLNLTIRYANASANNRSMSLSVNGVTEVATVNFAGTGAWTNWATTVVSISLNSGINTLRLTSLTSEGAPNIDELTFSSKTISMAGCGVAVVAPNPTSGNFSLSASESVQSFTVSNNIGTVVYAGGSIAVGGNGVFGDALGTGTYTLRILYSSGRTETRTIQKIQ